MSAVGQNVIPPQQAAPPPPEGTQGTQDMQAVGEYAV